MNNLGKLYSFSTVLTRKIYFELFTHSNFYTKQNVLTIHTSCKKLEAIKTKKTNVLVYEAPLKTRIRVVKCLSLSSSMLAFALFPSVMYDLFKANIYLGLASSIVSTFFLSTPFILHWITKSYVLELYYDTESQIFTAKTFNIVTQIKELKFKATDVTVPDLPGMLSSFLVKGKPLFVDANMVQDPDAYSHMMGYDKPFDIALKIDDPNEGTKTS